MANIGTVSVKLVANPEGLISGFNAAQARVSHFASQATGVLGRLARVGRDTLAGIGSGGLGGILGGITQGISGIVSMVPIVGPALAGMFGGAVGAAIGFVAWIREGMHSIIETGHAAHALGISTERMAGLMFFAGGQAEALETGMFRLARRLGEVAFGDLEAAAGFQRLGLDALELSALPLDQTLARVADRIRAMPSTAERAAAAFQLFGRSGAEMLPLLMRGSAGMEAAFQRAQRMGLTFSSGDFAQVIAAQRAIASIEQTVAGLRRQLAIQLAPVLQAIGNWFRDAAASGINFREVALNVAEAIISAIANLLTALQEVLDLILTIRNAGRDVGQVISQTAQHAQPFNNRTRAFMQDINRGTLDRMGLGNTPASGSVGTGLAAAQAAPPAPANWGERFRLVIQDLRNRIAGATGQIHNADQAMAEASDRAVKLAQELQTPWEKASAQLGLYDRLLRRHLISQHLYDRALEKTRTEALGAVGLELGGPLEKYRKQLELINRMSAANLLNSRQAGELTGRAFAGLAQATGLQTVDAKLAQIRQRLQDIQRLRDAGMLSARDFAEENRRLQMELLGGDMSSPLERFQQRIQQIQQLALRGAITEDLQARAIGRAVDELAQATQLAEHAPEALLAGTKEAMSAIARHERGAERDNPQRRIAALMDAAVRLQQEQLAAQRDTVRALGSLGALRPARF